MHLHQSLQPLLRILMVLLVLDSWPTFSSSISLSPQPLVNTSPRRQSLMPSMHPLMVIASEHRENGWRSQALKARLPGGAAGLLARIRGGNMATPRVSRRSSAPAKHANCEPEQDIQLECESEEEKSKLVCAVRSDHFFGTDRLKKWRGACMSASELRSHLLQSFQLPSHAVVQYFDNDLEEYVDLEDDVWDDLLDQKFPKIRIIRGKADSVAEEAEDNQSVKSGKASVSVDAVCHVSTSSSPLTDQLHLETPSSSSSSSPIPPPLTEPQPPPLPPLPAPSAATTLGSAGQTSMRATPLRSLSAPGGREGASGRGVRSTVRSCRLKKINYAESPLSSEPATSSPDQCEREEGGAEGREDAEERDEEEEEEEREERGQVPQQR
eukprot:3649478-Rhodomonas_salina.10